MCFPWRLSIFVGGKHSFLNNYPVDHRIISAYVTDLCTQWGLPLGVGVAIGVMSMLGFTRLSIDTYEGYVRSNAETVITEEILRILPGLFAQYGFTLPERAINIATVVSGVVANAANGQDRLSVLSPMLLTLSDQGIESPYFTPIRQAVFAAIAGGP